MKNTTEATFEMSWGQLLETHGKNTRLCDLPAAEFETGGHVTNLLAAVGYDESGRVTINHLGWWNLTTDELVSRAQEMFNAPESEEEAGEILALSAIHGELPGSIDVTVRNHSFIRVALNWEHLDDKMEELTDGGIRHIEAEVMREGGFSSVNWA